ncbi:ParA family protein [Halobacillus karajensis]|uniref:ParA family protein n=1 Tax=Halobacillus karajensis TaxID=195088 RepID=UPI00045D085E|nr:ParA family protein [Halobacillus karajensis]CDQ21744.1 Sporulation initiation inhibitor protein soj [Halobacillus karajensis]
MGKVLCFSNNKGGTLKTTTVVNLAGVISKRDKKKVLIIDCDFQSNVALSFGKNPDTFKGGLHDVLIDDKPPEDFIIKVHRRIDVLPATSNEIKFDFEVIANPNYYKEPFRLMESTCEHLKEKYDYILVDTSPSLGLMTGNAFMFSDEVYIPYSPEGYSRRSLLKVIETIEWFKDQHNIHTEIKGVIPTLVKRSTRLHNDIMKQTKKFADKAGIRIFNNYVPSTIEFASSIGYKQKPLTLSRKTKFREVYFELWKEMQGNE